VSSPSGNISEGISAEFIAGGSGISKSIEGSIIMIVLRVTILVTVKIV
jgi:hypothetical protein